MCIHIYIYIYIYVYTYTHRHVVRVSGKNGSLSRAALGRFGDFELGGPLSIAQPTRRPWRSLRRSWGQINKKKSAPLLLPLLLLLIIILIMQ